MKRRDNENTAPRSGQCTAVRRRPASPALWLGAVTLLAPVFGPLPAATITVEGGCSLVAAIQSANVDSAVGTCLAGDGADTLVLTADLLLQVFVDSSDGDNGLPSITSEIVIEGNGHTIERDGGAAIPKFRIFHIAATGDLTLDQVTVVGGSAREGASLQVRGGGLFNRGALTLKDSRIWSNEATVESSGGSTVFAYGGGIYNAGRLLIEDSEVSFNEARAGSVTGASGPSQAGGGGIHHGGNDTLAVYRSALVANHVVTYGTLTQSDGGALYHRSSQNTTRFEDSTISENRAFATGSAAVLMFGGAFWLGGPVGSTVLVNRCLFSDNRLATTSPNGAAAGGAVFNADHFLVRASSFVANRVDPPANAVLPSGGAIENRGGNTFLQRLTLTYNEISFAGAVLGEALNNHSGPMSLSSSIVAFGSAASDCGGTIADSGGNFGCFPGAPAVTGLTGTLGFNGGWTRTHALSATSNAINAGAALACFQVNRDQRGVSDLGACDSGSYEYSPCGIYDDGYETSDDACFGTQLTIGATQTHVHCDPDWVWFQAQMNRTYEIRTLDAVGQVVLSASTSCGAPFATTGPGPGDSRLIVNHPTFTNFDVEITQWGDSYDPGPSPPATVEGYDVRVVCIEDCGCSPPDGPNLDLSRDLLQETTLTYEACSTLTAGTDWSVLGPAEVTLRAGETVILENGVSIHPGATLTLEIDPLIAPP